MTIDSVPFRICIHLIKNPGAALFTNAIATMYGLDSKAVHFRLRSAVKRGWLAKAKSGNAAYYSAGEKLVEAMR